MRSRSNKAGAHEQQRYKEGLRAWRARVLPPLRWITIAVVVASFGFLAFGPVGRGQFIAGAIGGGFFSLYLWVRDEPPEHIERHRKGAEGERATDKVLRPLLAVGWRVAHDVDTGRGNRDHVLVGPPGVYLLDSKNLGGMVTVKGEIVRVERVDDPRDSYSFDRLASRLRGEAATIHDELAQATGLEPWVSAVVVFWSPFAARVVQRHKITFLHGNELVAWLRSQAPRYDSATVARLAEHISR